MKITVLTLFPQMLDGFFGNSIFKRARDKGLVDVELIDFRDFSNDKHRKVDDEIYSGGAGLLLKPQPLFDALNSISAKQSGARVVYPSPSGKRFDQAKAYELSREHELVFIAGHYEGVDQRVIDNYVTDELSIGDYVISSGEVATLCIIDAVYRLIPGVISSESLESESFSAGLLEYPQYTRPANYCNFSVPDVLLNGNHRSIMRWKREKSLEKTFLNRPDLLEKAILDDFDRRIIDDLRKRYDNGSD